MMIPVLLGMPFAAAGDARADDTSKGNELTQTYLVSTAAKNKALLLRVFEAVRKLEEEKRGQGKRTLEVRHRVSSTEFLVNAGGATDFWFMALAPKDLDNRDRFRTDAIITEDTKSFRDESGKTITVRVLKEVPPKPVEAFTKDEFVRRLKDGETWTLVEFEERKCKICGGDGMIEKPEEFVECGDCFDGKVSVDYLVKWW